MGTLHEVATWWADRLGEVAGTARRRGVGTKTAVLLDLRRGPDGMPSGLDLVLRRGRSETLAGSVAPDEAGFSIAAKLLQEHRGRSVAKNAMLLRLPPGELLERPLSLPLAVERDLDRVLAYEMDRIAPFSAADLFWTYELVGRDPARGRLDLRVALVPKAGLLPLIEALRRAGVSPTGLAAQRPDGSVQRIGLEPPGSRAARGRGERRAITLAASACAALAAIAMVLPFARQAGALADVEARIERLRPQVAEADALRRRIAEGRAGVDVFAAEAARLGRPLQAIATLTAILPDDTHLTAFALRQRSLAISGRSAAAARLIPALSADPAIRDAAFTAPVTRAEGGRADLFSIRAEFGS